MKTPTMVTSQEFGQLVEAFLLEKCEINKRYMGAITCKACGDHIQSVSAMMSVHFADQHLVCAGAGDVRKVTVPYCAKCEEKPATSGCFHEDTVEPPIGAFADVEEEASV